MTQNFYFEPPSRLQLVDKMAHLLRYSDFLVVITGPKGAGKTSVAKKLVQDTKANDIRQIAITLEGETDALLLAQTCAKVITHDDASIKDPLAILHEQSRILQDVGQHFFILIDNAEWLTDEAIELLSGLLISGIGKPKVVLSGQESLVNRLASLSIHELLEGKLHVEHLQPFDREEAKEFLDLRFSGQPELGKREFNALYDTSSGYPGRLTSATSAMYRSGRLGSNRAKKGWVLPLPLPHMLGIGFVFFIVILISVWQVMKTDESVEVEESSAQVATPLSADGRVSVPLAVDVRDTDKIQDQITQLKDERSELSKRLAEQESLIKEQLTTPLPLPGVTETQTVTDANEAGKDASSNESSVIAVLNQQEEAVTNSPDIAAVADKPEVKEVLPAVAEVAVAVQPKEEEKVVEKPAPVKPAIVEEKKPTVQAKESGWLKEKQLLAWPAKGYTLQLLGARSADSIDQFMRSAKEPEKIYYFQTMFKGAPWHVLVYGQYSNRDAAVRAVSALPEELRKMKPWPRSIKGVQADIQKK